MVNGWLISFLIGSLPLCNNNMLIVCYAGFYKRFPVWHQARAVVEARQITVVYGRFHGESRLSASPRPQEDWEASKTRLKGDGLLLGGERFELRTRPTRSMCVVATGPVFSIGDGLIDHGLIHHHLFLVLKQK